MYDYNYKDHLKPEEVLMYLRKSRADDPMLSVEEVLSKHEAVLDEWVANHLTAPIPLENRYKEVVSGESISDRPEFQRVLKAIESPNIKAVLVVEISRLGRPDTEEIGKISKMFRYTNMLVITPSRAFNIADKYERDMFEQELRIGNYYLEYVKTILRAGRESSVRRGCYVCSKPLYGYDKVTITEGRRKYPTLAINEEQSAIVRMIFDSYVNKNIGTQTIANQLNLMGVQPPQTSRWSADTIRDMLENPTYTGKVRWNERKAVLVVDDGEFKKTRPRNTDDDYILCDGLHEAIISEELFHAAQIKRKKSHRTCANKELRNPIAGLLYCECGRAMSYRHSTRGELQYREPRLVCNGQRHCGNGSCSVTEMIDFVSDLLRGKIAEYTENVSTDSTETATFHEKQVKTLERKLAELDAKELALWEAQLDTENKMPPHIMKSLTEKLAKEREETEAALAVAKEAVAKPINNEVKRVTLQNALDALTDDEVSVAEKNLYLKACFERITYHRAPAERIVGKGNGRGYTTPPIELDVKMLF